MATPKDTMWEIEPHTQAKHEILRRYLGAWFPILGKYHRRVVYIDGFCGPGRYIGGESGSPIIALQEALQHSSRLTQNNLMFLFMDERPDRINHLKHELSLVSIPPNFIVQAVPGDFAKEFGQLLDRLNKQGLQIAPTFAFIDPFGFKGLPFDLVRKLLKNPRTEIFINVMADSINRFLDHPDAQIRQHITDLFGTKKALDIASSVSDRISALRLLYQQQLSQCAKFVRYFEMRDAQNRIVYYLFFASNNALGHLKMKEAFWKVDSSTGFLFSDATDPNQLVLFEYDETPKLAKELQIHFAGQLLLVEGIQKYVIDETAFLPMHMRSALRLLESNNEIKVKILKQDGNKRRQNTFPDDVIVEFPK